MVASTVYEESRMVRLLIRLKSSREVADMRFGYLGVLFSFVVFSYAAPPWKLVPIKRVASLERRASYKRGLAPRETATLEFAISKSVGRCNDLY